MARRINGRILERLRYEHGLTQAQLAERIDVDRTVVVRMESGQRHGTPRQIKALAEVLGVDIDELTTNGEEVA